jgi:hypothetical protein
MKVFACTDSSLYVAGDAEMAAQFHLFNTGEPCEEGFPHELAEAEITQDIAQKLVLHGDHPGWLTMR